MDDHNHCDRDPIECSYDALVGELQAENEVLRQAADPSLRNEVDDASVRLVEAITEVDRLRAVVDADNAVLREWAERVATAAGVPLEWEEDSTVGQPGTPKYNDRLIHEVEEVAAERDRLRAVVEVIATVPPGGTTLVTPPTVEDLQGVARNALTQLDVSGEETGE